MIDAVVFDMDGTLINSIPVYLAAYERIFAKELGLSPDPKIITRQFGKSSQDILAGVIDEMKIDPKSIDTDAIIADIRQEFVKHIEDIIILPGAVELLKDLDDDYPLALATSSRGTYTHRILTKFGLDRYFEAVVTADDVVKAKPSPEIFLLAAKKLETPPKKCLVFEDAVFGVRAAKAAGTKVVGVTTGSASKEELLPEGPDAIISSLKEFNFGILK
jgi:beta-N-acetylhexosaminidase